MCGGRDSSASPQNDMLEIIAQLQIHPRPRISILGNRTLLHWLLLGLLLRLLLMPFTLNTDWRFRGDMVAIFAEASQISHQGQLYLRPGHPPLQVYLLAVPLIAFKPFMPLYATSSGGPFFGSDWPQTAHVFIYLLLLNAWYQPFDLLM